MKEIAFPTINAKQRVEQCKEERELNIQGDDGLEDDSIDNSHFSPINTAVNQNENYQMPSRKSTDRERLN